MCKSTLFFAKAALVAGLVLFASAQQSYAQRGGGGGGRGGGGFGGGGFGGGGRGGFGGAGYGGYGRGYGYGGFYGGGFYGDPFFYGDFGYGGYGYGYAPYAPYAPYYYDPYYYGPAYPPAVPMMAPATTGYQAFYPPAPTASPTATINVRVPADAQLWFDSNPTKQSGTMRQFSTPPLEAGKTFTYEIRATWMVDGTPTTQTRQVQVQAGKQSTVDFLTAVVGSSK